MHKWETVSLLPHSISYLNYRNDLLPTLKTFNSDIVKSFNEIKQLPDVQIDLIEDLVVSLVKNYNKLESYHAQEMLLKDNKIANISKEFELTQKQLKKALSRPDEDLSSFE
jgi:CRISPR/Cas system-associated endonuclease/helicase Cas3